MASPQPLGRGTGQSAQCPRASAWSPGPPAQLSAGRSNGAAMSLHCRPTAEGKQVSLLLSCTEKGLSGSTPNSTAVLAGSGQRPREEAPLPSHTPLRS